MLELLPRGVLANYCAGAELGMSMLLAPGGLDQAAHLWLLLQQSCCVLLILHGCNTWSSLWLGSLLMLPPWRYLLLPACTNGLRSI